MKVTCNGMYAEIPDDAFDDRVLDVDFGDAGFMLQFTQTPDGFFCTNAVDGWGNNRRNQFYNMKLEIV